MIPLKFVVNLIDFLYIEFVNLTLKWHNKVKITIPLIIKELANLLYKRYTTAADLYKAKKPFFLSENFCWSFTRVLCKILTFQCVYGWLSLGGAVISKFPCLKSFCGDQCFILAHLLGLLI